MADTLATVTAERSDLDELEEIERQSTIAVNSHARASTTSRKGWGFSPNLARASASREKPQPATAPIKRRPSNWRPEPNVVNVTAEQLHRTIVTAEEIRTAIIMRSMSEVVGAFRASRIERGVTCETVDQIAGWPQNYCSKLVCFPAAKNFGWMSLGEGFGALGKMLLLVDDPEQIERVKNRWTQRERPAR